MLEERLRLADGSTIAKGVVDHPGAVVLVPMEDDQVFMIRQYRLALKETILELPAGTRGWEEDWLACAQRELQEEIGYQAERFSLLGRIWPSPGMSNELMAIYLAEGLSPSSLPRDADEEIEVRPMPLMDVVAMVQDGRIQDAKSIIGILKAAAHRSG